MREITEEFVAGLYREHADRLRAAREEQRRLRATQRGMARVQLDDMEAEITYLLIRAFRPGQVVEIGCLHGWSTTWILRALRDNGCGRLSSFDRVDAVVGNIPVELAGVEWEFHHGDVRRTMAAWDREIDYLFIDAAHSAPFARWYLDSILSKTPPHAPVSVHDVFHLRRAVPFSEGAEIMKWLGRERIPYFTAARARAPETYTRLNALRRELGLATPVHDSRRNPMIYFRHSGAARTG